MPKLEQPKVREAFHQVRAYVHGDLGAHVDAIDDETFAALKDSLSHSGETIILTLGELLRVLRRYANAELSLHELTKWAAFTYHGYAPWIKSSRKYPLPIYYEERNEDLIAETMLELEQIGDRIDGEFSPERASVIIRKLEKDAHVP